MEYNGIAVPDLIPKTIVNVLSLLERGNDTYSWTLSKDSNGFSLVIKSNKGNRNPASGRKHHTRRAGLKGIHRVNILDEDSNTESAKIDTVHACPRQQKHKPPSKIARDRLRRKQYRLRKKQLREVSESRLNAVQFEEEISTCDSEHQTSVCNTLEQLNRSTPASVPAASCETSITEECTQSLIDTDIIDSDDDSDYNEQEHKRVNQCAHCKKKETYLEFVCPSCEAIPYCSLKCRAADLSWHAFVCRPLSTDF